MVKQRIGVKAASKILGLDVLSVQGALKNNALPIGGAWVNEGAQIYTYHISPHLLAEYTGIPEKELLELASQYK